MQSYPTLIKLKVLANLVDLFTMYFARFFVDETRRGVVFTYVYDAHDKQLLMFIPKFLFFEKRCRSQNGLIY